MATAPFKVELKCPELPITVQGLRLLGDGGRMAKAVARGMQEWGEETMDEVRRRTPVDTGALRGSLMIDPYDKGSIKGVVLSAGGPAKAYAVAVHEHLSEFSPPSWRGKEEIHWNVPGTGPKFIENPVRERWGMLDPTIGMEIEIELADVGLTK